MSTKEIVHVNPADFGLTHETARNIRDQFQPMLDRMVELEEEFNQVLTLDPTDPQTSEIAKSLRNRYVKIRTATAAIHKEQKAFYLNGGRFVDGWKNAQIFASQGKEEALLKIEKHLENLEAERIAKIQEDRANALSPYLLPGEEIPTNLGAFPDDVWSAYLQGRVKQAEDYKAAEKAAEEARIQAQKEEEERQRKIQEENAALKASLEQKAKEEAELREKIEQERKIRETRENALKAELEAKQREEAERAAAEQKRLQEEEAAKAALLSGTAEQIIGKWIDSFSLPEIDFQDPRIDDIALKFHAFKKWAKGQVTLTTHNQ